MQHFYGLHVRLRLPVTRKFAQAELDAYEAPTELAARGSENRVRMRCVNRVRMGCVKKCVKVREKGCTNRVKKGA